MNDWLQDFSLLIALGLSIGSLICALVTQQKLARAIRNTKGDYDTTMYLAGEEGTAQAGFDPGFETQPGHEE